LGDATARIQYAPDWSVVGEGVPAAAGMGDDRAVPKSAASKTAFIVVVVSFVVVGVITKVGYSGLPQIRCGYVLV
jgi:hypothetical protein